MKVTLTGATGFIGSHILAELQEHGHEVTALVRDDAQADSAAARGATPAIVDLYDRPAVTSKFSRADGAIHTASPGDATSANLDSAVAGAAADAFAGTGKPYLHISGDWIYGDNTAITEESPIMAPAMVAWREPSQPARPERSPAPTMRPGHAWASTSPKSFCSIRAPTRPKLKPSSVGIRPIPRLPTSSATGATEARPTEGSDLPLRGPSRAPT